MIFFVVVNVVTHFIYFIDIEPISTKGLSRHVCAIADEERVIPEVDVALCGVERNLTSLTANVLMIYVEDSPLCMKWNIIGVPWP